MSHNKLQASLSRQPLTTNVPFTKSLGATKWETYSQSSHLNGLWGQGCQSPIRIQNKGWLMKTTWQNEYLKKGEINIPVPPKGPAVVVLWRPLVLSHQTICFLDFSSAHWDTVISDRKRPKTQTVTIKLEARCWEGFLISHKLERYQLLRGAEGESLGPGAASHDVSEENHMYWGGACWAGEGGQFITEDDK